MVKIKLVFVAFVLTCCNMSDSVKQLSGGWTYAKEGRRDKAIATKDRFIPCEVTHFGYDDNFIIALQRPSDECFLGLDSNQYSSGKDSTHYWIVIHKEKLLLGPLRKSDFEKYKRIYDIPNNIELTATH